LFTLFVTNAFPELCFEGAFSRNSQDSISQMNHSPYYGQRRPSMQRGSKLQCVSDLLLLGKATIDEARSLLYWLQNEAGYGKMGICGLSMGTQNYIVTISGLSLKVMNL
jgi:hypothetical protein